MVRSPGAAGGGSAGGVINKGPWTEAEDEVLSAHVKAHGEGNWRLIPKLAGLSRCGKSCRLRWINYLRPDLKRGNFSLDEDNLILTLHALLGNRWSLIAGRIPGRTDNEIKNYWNTHLRRKLRSMGIDPMSYKVGLKLLSISCDPGTTTTTTSAASDQHPAAADLTLQAKEAAGCCVGPSAFISLTQVQIENSNSTNRNHSRMAAPSLPLPQQHRLVSSPDDDDGSATSTSFDDSPGVPSEPDHDSSPNISSRNEIPASQLSEPWMDDWQSATNLDSHDQPNFPTASSCDSPQQGLEGYSDPGAQDPGLQNMNAAGHASAAGGWDYEQFSRMEHLQLLDHGIPCSESSFSARLGMLQPPGPVESILSYGSSALTSISMVDFDQGTTTSRTTASSGMAAFLTPSYYSS